MNLRVSPSIHKVIKIPFRIKAEIAKNNNNERNKILIFELYYNEIEFRYSIFNSKWFSCYSTKLSFNLLMIFFSKKNNISLILTRAWHVGLMFSWKGTFVLLFSYNCVFIICIFAPACTEVLKKYCLLILSSLLNLTCT